MKTWYMKTVSPHNPKEKGRKDKREPTGYKQDGRGTVDDKCS